MNNRTARLSFAPRTDCARPARAPAQALGFRWPALGSFPTWSDHDGLHQTVLLPNSSAPTAIVRRISPHWMPRCLASPLRILHRTMGSSSSTVSTSRCSRMSIVSWNAEGRRSSSASSRPQADASTSRGRSDIHAAAAPERGRSVAHRAMEQGASMRSVSTRRQSSRL